MIKLKLLGCLDYSEAHDEYSVKDEFCQLCLYARSNAGYPDVITIIDEAKKYANIKIENK